MADADIELGSNRSWCLPFGKKAPKAQVVFFVQTSAAFLLIITSIVSLLVPGLATTQEERSYWKIALSGTIGYLFPNPSLTYRQSQT